MQVTDQEDSDVPPMLPLHLCAKPKSDLLSGVTTVIWQRDWADASRVFALRFPLGNFDMFTAPLGPV